MPARDGSGRRGLSGGGGGPNLRPGAPPDWALPD